MITCKKWDIVLVPFPFTDLSTTKKRPALIVSPTEYNYGNEIVIAFVTSNLKSERTSDHIIREWQLAKLPKPSLIRMRFATIDRKMVIKTIGKLNGADITEFAGKIASFCGGN